MHFKWIYSDSKGIRVRRQNLLFYENLISRSDLNCFHLIPFAIRVRCVVCYVIVWERMFYRNLPDFEISICKTAFEISECVPFIVLKVSWHMYWGPSNDKHTRGWYFPVKCICIPEYGTLHSCHVYMITHTKNWWHAKRSEFGRCFDDEMCPIIVHFLQTIPNVNIIWIILTESFAVQRWNAVTKHKQRVDSMLIWRMQIHIWDFYDDFVLKSTIESVMKIYWFKLKRWNRMG